MSGSDTINIKIHMAMDITTNKRMQTFVLLAGRVSTSNGDIAWFALNSLRMRRTSTLLDDGDMGGELTSERASDTDMVV